LSAPTPEEITRQLELISLSQSLGRALLRRKLLQYLVKSTVAGTKITETTIATVVYGKKTHEYNPAVDGLVRVEKSKLSKALTKYYRDEGKGDLVRISIDGYRAVFTYAPHHQPAASPTPSEHSDSSTEGPDFISEPRDWEDKIRDVSNPTEIQYAPRHYRLLVTYSTVRLPVPFARWLWSEEEGRVYVASPDETKVYLYPRNLPKHIYPCGVDEYGEPQVDANKVCWSIKGQVECNGCLDIEEILDYRHNFRRAGCVIWYAKRERRRRECLILTAWHRWVCS
jgi:hypothetical protein